MTDHQVIRPGPVGAALDDFSGGIRPRKDALVTHGPYKFCRHPMYASGAVFCFAASFVSANWMVLVAGVLFYIVPMFGRIGAEEALLRHRFGEEHRHYAERTPVLLPSGPSAKRTSR